MGCRHSSTIHNSMRVTAPAFEKVTASLGELQLKIAAAEEQWLELEILREELTSS